MANLTQNGNIYKQEGASQLKRLKTHRANYLRKIYQPALRLKPFIYSI
jgi:hypothetical protein